MVLPASESGNPACWTGELALIIPRLVASCVSCGTCSSVWESRGMVRTASANIASWRRFRVGAGFEVLHHDGKGEMLTIILVNTACER